MQRVFHTVKILSEYSYISFITEKRYVRWNFLDCVKREITY